jgi:hypothetical protein
MSLTRLFPCPPMPLQGYPDWPPVRALLRMDFAERFAWLEEDMFLDAFPLAGRTDSSALARAEQTKKMALALILDRNLPLAFFMTQRIGLVTETALRDIVSEAWTRAVAGESFCTVDRYLCDWHDAHQESVLSERNRLKRQCIRRLIQKSARAELKNQMLTVDDESLSALCDWAAYRDWDQPVGIDRELMRQAVASILAQVEDRTDRRIFDLHHLRRMTLQKVRDELEARGPAPSIATIQRRAAEIMDAVLSEYERLRHGLN